MYLGCINELARAMRTLTLLLSNVGAVGPVVNVMCSVGTVDNTVNLGMPGHKWANIEPEGTAAIFGFVLGNHLVGGARVTLLCSADEKGGSAILGNVSDSVMVGCGTSLATLLASSGVGSGDWLTTTMLIGLPCFDVEGASCIDLGSASSGRLVNVDGMTLISNCDLAGVS